MSLGQELIDDAKEHSVEEEENQEIIADFEGLDTKTEDDAPADDADSADKSEEESDKDENEKDKDNPDKSKEDAPDKDEDDPRDSRITELKAELATANQRFHANQGSFTRGQQKISKLEKDIEDLKAEKLADKDDEDIDFFDDDEEDKDKDNPDKDKIPQVDEATDQRIQNLESDAEKRAIDEATDKWNTAEVPVKEVHDDYDEMINIIEPEIKSNPALYDEFMKKGATPEAAYEMGQSLYAVRNPEKVKEALRVEAEQETKTKSQKKDISLSPNSQTPSGDKADGSSNDLVDKLLAGR